MSVAGILDDDDKWLAYIATLDQDDLDDMLVDSASKGNLWQVEKLLFYGADAQDESSNCLHYAVMSQSPEIIERLVQAGADVNARPFMCIGLAYGYTESAMKLYDLGADPYMYHRGLDAYEWSRETGNIAMLEKLNLPRPEKPQEPSEKIGTTLSRASRIQGKRYKI